MSFNGCKPTLTQEDLKNAIRDHYAKVVTSDNRASDVCCGVSSCSATNTHQNYAKKMGYKEEDLNKVPERANLSLGCGNPSQLANLMPGEVVLDLGSGAGFDAFIVARIVGPTGIVIGVDMTPEMVSKAQLNAKISSYKNVEFRLGQIEKLPVDDSSIDVVISNCAINMVPNKAKAFKEVHRVLRSGGRLAITDVVTNVELPESVRQDLALHTGCLAGATLISDLEKILKKSGFVGIKITPIEKCKEFIKDWAPGIKLEESVFSADIEAKKP